MKQSDIFIAIKPVVEAFEKLGVSYYIGGSVASSAYGMARATMDVDIVANLKPQQVRSLVKILEQSYYISNYSEGL
jgi:tRNA nucleotidyltransferase/poly(A) polymerase